MSRIAPTFSTLQAQRRKALIPYIMAGFPDRDGTPALMHALVQGGADVIELGIPFSDPMADGAVIQTAGEAAIAQGVGLPQVLDAVREFRQTNTTTPVVLMGYANSIEAYNQHHASASHTRMPFADDAAAAGVDGVLVVDYPPEEARPLVDALHQHGLDLIFLLAPTSTESRIQKVADMASGYVYYVSLKGVTGSGALDTQSVADAVARIRQHVHVPLGVGFGIRDAATACAIAAHADAVVIGSRVIQSLHGLQGDAACQAAASFLTEIRKALDA